MQHKVVIKQPKSGGGQPVKIDMISLRKGEFR